MPYHYQIRPEELDYRYETELSDKDVLQAVGQSIRKDEFIRDSDKSNINISVKNGVVILEGIVSNHRAKRNAFLDAYWSVGVRDVINRVQVWQTPAQIRYSLLGN